MEQRSTILVDVPDVSMIDIGFLEDLGHPVIVCHGPPQGSLCPILSTGSCPKAEAAHGIVFGLDLDRPQHRAILARYREVLGVDVPIRVATTPEQAHRYAPLLADVQVWIREPTTGDLDGFAALVETADDFREAEQIA